MLRSTAWIGAESGEVYLGAMVSPKSVAFPSRSNQFRHILAIHWWYHKVSVILKLPLWIVSGLGGLDVARSPEPNSPIFGYFELLGIHFFWVCNLDHAMDEIFVGLACLSRRFLAHHGELSIKKRAPPTPCTLSFSFSFVDC